MRRPGNDRYAELDKAVFEMMTSFDESDRAHWKAMLAEGDRMLVAIRLQKEPTQGESCYAYIVEADSFDFLAPELWQYLGAEHVLKAASDIFGRLRAAGDETLTPVHPDYPNARLFGLGLVTSESFGTPDDSALLDGALSDSFYVTMVDGNVYVRRHMGTSQATNQQDFLGGDGLDKAITEEEAQEYHDRGVVGPPHAWLWQLLYTLVAPPKYLAKTYPPTTTGQMRKGFEANLGPFNELAAQITDALREVRAQRQRDGSHLN